MSPLWTGLLIAAEILAYLALGVTLVWLVVSRRWKSMAQWLEPFPLEESRLARVSFVGCWWVVVGNYLISRLARKLAARFAGGQTSRR